MTTREHAIHQGQFYPSQFLRIREETCRLRQPGSTVPLETAVNTKEVDLSKWIMEQQFGFVDGLSPFQLSVLLHFEKLAHSLGENLDLDIAVQTSAGWQALHCAAHNGSANMVRLCLDLGADVHARTHIGETALNKACRSGSLDCVKALIEAGAQVDVADNWGWTISTKLRSPDRYRLCGY